MKKIFLFLICISNLSAREIDERFNEEYLTLFKRQYETFENGSDQAKMAICENILSSPEEVFKTNPLVTSRAGSYLITKGREKEGVNLLVIGTVMSHFDILVATEVDRDSVIPAQAISYVLYFELFFEKPEAYISSLMKKIQAVTLAKLDWILDAKFSYDPRWPLETDEDVKNKWPTEARIQEIRNELKQ